MHNFYLLNKYKKSNKNTNAQPSEKKISLTKFAGKVKMIIFFDDKSVIYPQCVLQRLLLMVNIMFWFWKFFNNMYR